jgi:hypothetical protein
MTNHIHTKPRTYRWLSWLLRVVIPVMVVPPLLWTIQEFPKLEPISSRMQEIFNDYGFWVSGIGEAADNSTPFNTWCIEGRDGMIGDRFTGFVFELPNGLLFPFVTFDEAYFGDANELYDEFYQEHPEYQDESVAQGTDFSRFNCTLKRPRTVQNMAVYGSGGLLGILAGLLGIFAIVRFDGQSENPLIEYGIITGLAVPITVISGAWLYMLPTLLISGLIAAYLFINREVL